MGIAARTLELGRSEFAKTRIRTLQVWFGGKPVGYLVCEFQSGRAKQIVLIADYATNQVKAITLDVDTANRAVSDFTMNEIERNGQLSAFREASNIPNDANVIRCANLGETCFSWTTLKCRSLDDFELLFDFDGFMPA